MSSFASMTTSTPFWKPLAPLFNNNPITNSSSNNSDDQSSSSTFFNSDLIEFAHINDERGNGIVAKQDITILDKNGEKDFIIEPALVCSVSSESRKRYTNKNDYCSLCGAFLISGLRKQVQKILMLRKYSQDDLDRIVEAVETVARLSGFSRLPVWFQQEQQTSYFQQRCTSCHENRVLVKKQKQSSFSVVNHDDDHPQSLEEILLLLLAIEDTKNEKLCTEHVNAFYNLAVNVDEGLLCVMRTCLMLLDEVKAMTLMNSSSSEEKCQQQEQQEPEKNDDDDENHQGSENLLSSRIQELFSKRLDDFCSCFDEGVATIKEGSGDVLRLACKLLNEILSALLVVELPAQKEENTDNNNNKNNKDDNDENRSTTTTPMISIQQFFLLRCVLQNNQHRSVIANPLRMFLRQLPFLKPLVENNEDNSETNELLQQQQQFSSSIELIKSTISNDENVLDFLLPDITASALFLNTSRLNHSCKPNAHVEPSLMRSGASIRVSSLLSCQDEEQEAQDENKKDENSSSSLSVSTKIIKKGEEIRISYIGYGESKMKGTKEEIHQYLKRNYGFDCDC